MYLKSFEKSTRKKQTEKMEKSLYTLKGYHFDKIDASFNFNLLLLLFVKPLCDRVISELITRIL